VIQIAIPGRSPLQIDHLVLDFNGTLAHDGQLLEGVAERITALSAQLKIHILTADTHGSARAQVADLPCELAILPAAEQDTAKREFVLGLGATQTASIGNGLNDRLMLREATLGIAVLGKEGVAVGAITSADVLTSDIIDALDLLIHPLRLIATLRV
jgi:P-type E1-E2 ATPase